MNSYISEIDIKNTRTRCEICSKITIKTPKLFYCWLLTCTLLLGSYLHFYCRNHFHYLDLFYCLHDWQKIGIWCTFWNWLRRESHIDLCTQCVKMTLAGGGLSLMTFWNYCSCVTIFFSHNYWIVQGKRSFTNKESS